MLFDKIPFLYGSGIILDRFKEIRETVKNVIMRTFFDREYLTKYLDQKAPTILSSLNLNEKLKQLLESPTVDALIDSKLTELNTKPEGMLFAMMGMNLLQLKPLIKPFVVGMGSELIPLLTKNLEPSKMLDIGFLREEVDNLMSEKLEELTPERVKTLIEDVIRDHLGWLIVWGNIFGGLVGIASTTVEIIFQP